MSKKGGKGKKGQEEPRILLGRPGNNLKMGIIGFPNVGKTSFFNVLAKDSSSDGAGNINVSCEDKAKVPDPRHDWMTELYKPVKSTPAWVFVYDVGAMIKGSSDGGPLGNTMLSQCAGSDGLFHVLRAFEDDSLFHVEETVDPVRDLTMAQEEMLVKDLEQAKAARDRTEKSAGRGATGQKLKKIQDEIAIMDKIIAVLDEKKCIRFVDWKSSEIEVVNSLQLLTAKTCVHIVNISKRDYLRKKNKWLPKIKVWLDEHSGGEVLIPFSVEFEVELASMSENERASMLEENKTQSCYTKVLKAAQQALQLVNFFTVGEDEVKSWTVRAHTKAPAAAGTIHTDLERGFICAETMHYDDLKEHGTENDVKAAGKFRQEGKEYEVVDGDIIHVKFNVTAKKK